MHKDMYSHCKKHMHRYVLAQMKDGSSYDGIIADVDTNNLYLAVPTSGMDMNGVREYEQTEYQGAMYPEAIEGLEHGEQRQPWYPYYPGYYPPYYPGYYPYYPYPYYYRRPFRRLILPLAGLAALSLLPYW